MNRTTRFLLCAWVTLLTMPCFATDQRSMTVKRADLHGWGVALQKGTMYESGEGVATGQFVKCDGCPLGQGCFELKAGASYKNPLSKSYLGTNELKDMSPSRITQLRMSICPMSNETNAAQPITVELAVGDSSHLRLYTFLPWGFNPAGYYRRGQWREINILKPEGAWELTNIEDKDSRGGWAWLMRKDPSYKITVPPQKDWPNGTISGAGLNIKIGSGSAFDQSHGAWWRESSDCRCLVDKVIIGYRDDSGKEIVTTYDFEPDADSPSPKPIGE